VKIAIDARKIMDTGIGTYIRGVLGELAKLDQQNEYFLFLPSAVREQFDFGPNFQRLTDDSKGYSMREHIFLSWKIARLKPDLLHVPHYVMPMLQRWPTVVTIHDVIHLRYPQFLPYLTGKYYARYMLSRAVHKSAAVLTVSQASKDDLVQMLNAPEEKIRVVHNAVDRGFVPLAPEKVAAWRRQLGLPDRFILYVGALKEHKNVPMLIRSYLDYARRVGGGRPGMAPYKLVVTGQGAELAGLGAELRRAMTDSVYFLSNVPHDQLPYLYNCCSLFVTPSLCEGFGLPPLEAMACGWPVLASDIAAHREILGEAAEYFDPNDQAGLSRRIEEILGDNEIQRRLAAAGRRQVANYSWAKAAQQTLEVYRSVADGERQ